MSVALTTNLPAQPTQGITNFVPLGGDGKSAPLGCYFVRAEVDGDASGGGVNLTVNMDVRYTNLVAYVNPVINVDAAAGDFAIRIGDSDQVARAAVVGTIPHVATTVVGDNAAFLWFPPPLYFQGGGTASFFCPNVGVLETYKLFLEIYVFDINVLRLQALPMLQLNVPGVSAPAAV